MVVTFRLSLYREPKEPSEGRIFRGLGPLELNPASYPAESVETRVDIAVLMARRVL